MTAVALVFTTAGCVIAADGRLRWGADSTADEITRIRETDKQQKIFEITESDRLLAYALMGSITNKDGSFDLVREASKQKQELSQVRISSAQSYALEFSQGLKKALQKAKDDGRIAVYPNNEDCDPAERFLIARVIFAGYFAGQPCQVTARLFHADQILCEPKIEATRFSPGGYFVFGSPKIAELMFEKHDHRFEKYRKPVPRIVSLQGAALFSKGYIGACCDPCATEVDPLCKGIGGHIHIAEITPNGFRWRVPPIT